MLKKLPIYGAMLVVAASIAVPAFAQLLPEDQSGVADPSADATGAEPATPGGSGTTVVPVELTSELCSNVTDPLVVGTFEQVMPDVVQGCRDGFPMPEGTASEVPDGTTPAEAAPLDTAAEDATTPEGGTTTTPGYTAPSI